jgi:hypothetical protein
MLRLDSDKPVEFCDGLRRRDFLHAGALSMLGLGLNDLFAMKAQGAVDAKKDTNCIMLFLVGGPSQLDTWDMKPNAPIEIRGPYKPIKTNVPGIEISENFPRMAKHADKYALIRSVYHTAAAVHDTGHQMMQTGRLFQGGVEYPHIGCVLSKLKGAERRRAAARAAAAPHRQHRRQYAARAERRISGQDLRSVRAERRPFGPEFQSAGHAAAGLSLGAARGPAQELAGDGGSHRQQVRNFAGRAPVRRHVPSGLHADVVAEGARGVRTGARARAGAPEIRAEPVWAELPAGAAADRGGRALRDRQHVRNGVRRDHLGYSRIEAVQPDQLLSRPGGADVRHGLQSLLEDLHDRGC